MKVSKPLIFNANKVLTNIVIKSIKGKFIVILNFSDNTCSIAENNSIPLFHDGEECTVFLPDDILVLIPQE